MFYEDLDRDELPELDHPPCSPSGFILAPPVGDRGLYQSRDGHCYLLHIAVHCIGLQLEHGVATCYDTSRGNVMTLHNAKEISEPSHLMECLYSESGLEQKMMLRFTKWDLQRGCVNSWQEYRSSPI